MASNSTQLAPLPKRMAVFGVMFVIAVACIWAVDRRARQHAAAGEDAASAPVTSTAVQP